MKHCDKRIRSGSVLPAALMILATGAAFAHSNQEVTFPEDGAVLSAPPDFVSMTFDSPMRITVIRLIGETDGAPFTVDNLRQNQTAVPLGPWYLVWDNISNPARLAEGAGNWPYQVHEVNLVSPSDRALLPDGLAPPNCAKGPSWQGSTACSATR